MTPEQIVAMRSVADAAIAMRDCAHLPVTGAFRNDKAVKDAWWQECLRLSFALDEAIFAYRSICPAKDAA